MAAARADRCCSEGGSADAGLLDLYFLTDEERTKIEQVLAEDQKLLMHDRVRLG